jgi:hypothetical protein
MKEKKILVIIKKPGEPPVVEPLFDNTLEAFQKEVGGYIETVTFASDAALVVNEEGLLMGLRYNCKLCNLDLVGTIICVGVKGDEFVSLRAASVPMLLRAMGG